MGKSIVLVGAMGAGKSTVGKALAAELGLPFIDVDEEIISHEKISISKIFATKGEFDLATIK